MKYNKKIKHSPFIILFVVLVILLTACSSTKQQQFQFPLNKEDVEKVITDKEFNWFIKNLEYRESSETIYIRK